VRTRAASLLSLSLLGAAFMLAGCPSADAPPPPPREPKSEPLVIGKTPSAPPLAIASSEKPAGPDESGRVARGNAPAIWLDSFTTPGKVSIPANKVVLITFWATWCMPCTQAFPKMQDLYAKYKGRGFEIAAISVDDEKAAILPFVRQHGVQFPVGWDEGHKITDQYKPSTMPTDILVDRAGNIFKTHLGYHDGEEVEIEREIQSLL